MTITYYPTKDDVHESGHGQIFINCEEVEETEVVEWIKNLITKSKSKSKEVKEYRQT